MQYLFVFGYCTPQQWINNARNSWDDEDSYAFFVEAENAEAALAWGKTVAEAYVQHLFQREQRPEPMPSGEAAGFAHWIEHQPFNRFSGLALEMLPVVINGEMPDFGSWPKAKGFGVKIETTKKNDLL